MANNSEMAKKDDLEQTRESWDRLAADWEIQVGDDGDNNRRLNSDPVLWAFVGDVGGKYVLDVGCGTGYLTRHLHDRGAMVIGIDHSAAMIQIARQKSPEIDYRVECASEIRSVSSGTIDVVVSNYVLMDTADLDGTVNSIGRVLKPAGVAVLVFSHPCFPQGDAINSPVDGTVQYHWPHSYFECCKRIDPPWHHFRDKFIWFHRPLSVYWKAFRAAGFLVEELEEPRITPNRYHLAASEKMLANCKSRPYSVAFKLRKGNSIL